MQKEIIKDCILYCGDSADIINSIDECDSLITDPPYGLGKLSGTTSIKRNRNAYQSYEDSEENLIKKIIPIVKMGLGKCNGRGLVTSGAKCMYLYPRPTSVGGFFQPAAVGMNPWGFNGYNPVLFYGTDPRSGKGQTNTMISLTERASSDLHPCAKPYGAMTWMVNKGSLHGENLLELN